MTSKKKLKKLCTKIHTIHTLEMSDLRVALADQTYRALIAESKVVRLTKEVARLKKKLNAKQDDVMEVVDDEIIEIIEGNRDAVLQQTTTKTTTHTVRNGTTDDHPIFTPEIVNGTSGNAENYKGDDIIGER